MKYINKIEYIDDKECRVIADSFDVYKLDTYTVSTSEICEGKECEDSVFERVVFESECIRAENEAIKYLSSRMRTGKQVREHLKEKGYTVDMIAHVYGKLLSWGYIDDAAYSKMYIEYRLTNSKKSWRAIFYDLKYDGVDGETITSVSQSCDIDENERAYDVALKIVREKRDEKTLKRLQGTLSRNGFYWDEIRYVLSKLGCNETEDYYA